MTEEQEQNSPFNQRADNAALALRQRLQQDGAQIADGASVEVGPDGKPPPSLPPVGSYARTAIEQQRAAQAQRDAASGQPTQEQVLGNQPPAGTPEQAIDGSVAPPLTTGQTPPEPPAERLSPNAERRIQDLVAELRMKDQELQQVLTQAKANESTTQELRTELESLKSQHEQMIQANLDNLDPETRLQVMQDARISEALAGMEQRIMGQIMPHVTNLQQQNVQSEMMALSEKYPAFDLQIHGPLIDMFRGKNTACTVEQAFRAIAEGDEATPRVTAAATAVPPTVPPGTGPPTPRYVPEPTSTSSPEQELIEEAQMLKKLRASDDPDEQKLGLRLADQHIAARLGGRLPG